MNPYLAIVRARIFVLFQYRSAALAGLVTQVFWAIVKIMILQAFYAGASGPQPITLAQAITFIWLGQALLQLLTWKLDPEVEELVKNGNVAYELVRPLDLYWLWYAKGVAMRAVPTFLRCIPVFIVAFLVFDLPPPVSGKAALGFAASVACSSLLSSAVTTLVVISLFWTLSGEGIQRMLPHLSVLLSGIVVPLPLFPDWMQTFLSLQPLRGIIDIPCRLYTGVIAESEIPYYIAFQLLWTAFLILVGRLLMKKAIHRIEIQGG